MSADLGSDSSSGSFLADASQGVYGVIGVGIIGIFTKLIATWSRRRGSAVQNYATVQEAVLAENKRLTEERNELWRERNELWLIVWQIVGRHPLEFEEVKALWGTASKRIENTKPPTKQIAGKQE